MIGSTFPLSKGRDRRRSLYATIAGAERRTTAGSTPTARFTAGRSRTSSSTTSTRRRRRSGKVKKLVESDHVFAIVGSLGTAPGLATWDYLNSNEGAAGAARHAATRTGARARRAARVPSEALLHEAEAVDDGLAAGLPGRGEALREVHPQPPGKPAREDRHPLPERRLRPELPRRVHEGASERKRACRATREAYTAGEMRRTSLPPHRPAQGASGANTVVLFSTPSASISALIAGGGAHWSPRRVPQQRLGEPVFMLAAERHGANVDGVISTTLHQEPDGHAERSGDAAREDDHLRHRQRRPEDQFDIGDNNLVYGLAVAWTAVDALKHSGANPTRGSLMHALRTLNETGSNKNPFVYPGMVVKTSVHDAVRTFPMEQLIFEKWAARPRRRRLENVRQRTQQRSLNRSHRCLRGGASAPPLFPGLGLFLELGRIRDGSAAGEPLARVDGGLALDEILPREQRDVLRRAEGDDDVRVEAGERGARHGRAGAAGDGELARRREVEVECAQRPAERRRRARQVVADERERSDRSAARAPRRPRSARAAGGRTRASSCPTGSGCRRATSAARRAVRRRPARGRSRRAPRLRRARSRGPRRGGSRAASADRPSRHATRRSRARRSRSRRGTPGNFARPSRIVRHSGSASSSSPSATAACDNCHLRDGALPRRAPRAQARSRGDHLVVAERLRPAIANREEPRARLVIELAAQDRASMLERLQSSAGAPSSSVHVCVRPSTPSVSASCADAKPPLRGATPAPCTRASARRHRGSAPRRHEPRMEVRRHEQRVVVEHLLEVRHEPIRVDASSGGSRRRRGRTSRPPPSRRA